MLVELHRRADLLDRAGVHHGDAVADRVGLFLVVGDEDRGEAEPLLQRRAARAARCTRILASRFDSGSSSSSTLGSMAMVRATATRCCWPPESCAGRRSARPTRPTRSSACATRRSISARGRRRSSRPKATFLRHRHVRPQRVALEHHADIALPGRQRRHVLAVEQHPAGLGLGEARDQPQQRGLAAARGAEEGEELAGTDREVDVLQHVRRAVGEVDARDLDADGPCWLRHGHARHISRPARALRAVDGELRQATCRSPR